MITDMTGVGAGDTCTLYPYTLDDDWKNGSFETTANTFTMIYPTISTCSAVHFHPGTVENGTRNLSFYLEPTEEFNAVQ